MKLNLAAASFAIVVLSAGAVAAAEACACCKEGAKMECCDKMKDKAASPAKPGDTKPAQPEHQH